MSNDSQRLPVAVKAVYGVGQIAEGIKSAAFGLFVMFYYNQLLGLPGSLAGLSLLIALVFDAITDPLVGSLSDRWKSRWGRRHPFMYVSALPLGITFFLLFAPPAGLDQFGLFLWLTVFGILARGAITLFYIPHQALGAELTTDYGERTAIVQYRQGLAIVGSLLCYAIAFLLFFGGPEGQKVAGNYPGLAATLSIVMVAAIAISALGTHSRIPTLVRPPADSRITPVQLLADMVDTLKNPSFAWFFTGVVIIFLMVGVDSALALYVNTYFWQIAASDIFFWSIAYPIGAIAGAFATRALHARFDKRPVVIFGSACWALCQIVPVLLFLAGLFPEAGSDTLVWTLVAIRFIQGAGTVQALITAGAMIADIADEHELRTHKRQEGVFFGALSFSGKVSTGLGNFIAGMALEMIAWPTGAEVTVSDVAPEKIVWLGLLYGPIVAGFAVVAIYCYTRYQLDRERHAEILVALSERKRGAPPEDARDGALGFPDDIAADLLPVSVGPLEEPTERPDKERLVRTGD
ncbi:MAG: hypothetical protein GC199_02185 [Alphaproteobacteria bacterium]|nr:hypothetical protein [Alphaproteobacteria bacterium]